MKGGWGWVNTHPNKSWPGKGDVACVTFYQGREANLHAGLAMTWSFVEDGGVGAPRDKLFVEVHLGDNVKHLFHGVPVT